MGENHTFLQLFRILIKFFELRLKLTGTRVRKFFLDAWFSLSQVIELQVNIYLYNITLICKLTRFKLFRQQMTRYQYPSPLNGCSPKEDIQKGKSRSFTANCCGLKLSKNAYGYQNPNSDLHSER
jgi:hypothetical protein